MPHRPLTAALLLASLLLPAQATPEAPASGDPQLVMLAKRGDFAAVRRAVGDNAPGLSADLKDWEAMQARRTQARHASFKAKCAELDASLAAGEIEKALVDLIEAKILADDATAFLAEPRSAALVKKVEGMAAQYQAEHNWIEAGTLYRLLNTLFDKTRPYLDQGKRVAQHEQALALYNPKKLIALYKEQGKRLKSLEKLKKKNKKTIPTPSGEDPVADPEIELTPWQDRLGHITPRILHEALFYAAKKHIDHHGYAELVEGAINGLGITLDTDGLAETLPALKDQAKLAAFQKKLAALAAECRAAGKKMTLSGALGMLQRAMDANAATVGLPKEVVIYELGMGLQSRLDDFSNIIWPDQIPEFERMISGEFFGIGVQLSREPGELTVITPMASTPAMRAGIHAGDVITHVNGKPTSTWTVDKAIKEITGPEGTEVTLRVRRSGSEEPLEFKLKRAKIEVDSIRGWSKVGDPADGRWNFWLDKGNGIAYIRMSQFIQQTTADLDKAVKQLKSEGKIKGMILDLRYNPGGLLHAAAVICDRFLKEGPIVSTVDAENRQNQLFSAGPGDEYGDFPVVVLVNEGSASASEILSGALQESHRVTVIGTNSFGKGSVQNILSIAKDTALFKLTLEHYALPTGRIIHREKDSKIWGIQPDIEVKMTPDELRAMADARSEADLGQDLTPEDHHAVRTAADILKEGLDPQVATAKVYLETLQKTAGAPAAKTAVSK